MNHEHTDHEIESLLTRTGKDVRPSESLLHAALEKLEPAPIKSPFMGIPSPFRFGIPVFMVAVLLIGGVTLTHQSGKGPDGTASPSVAQTAGQDTGVAMSNPSDTSDAALAQDANAIDSEMSALNSDAAAADTAASS